MEGTREEPRRTGAPQGSFPSLDQVRTAGIDNLAGEQALRPLYEVNQQCIELLVKAAWSDRPTLPLVRQFQGSLRNLSAQARARAAQKAFLLVDMEFMNGGWWELAKKQSSRITSPARMMKRKCLPLAASNPMSFTGSPSTTSRSAFAPGRTQPSLPCCCRRAALVEVACRRISTDEKTSFRISNSRHWLTYVEPSKSVPNPMLTSALRIDSSP